MGTFKLAIISVLLTISAYKIGHYLGYNSGDSHGTAAANQKWQNRWDKRDKDELKLKADFEERYRVLEGDYNRKLAALSNEAEVKNEKAKKDAATATRAISRLHQRLAALQREAAADDASTGSCKATSRTLVLYSELLGASNTRNQQLAEYADALRRSNTGCERAYDFSYHLYVLK